MTHLEPFALQLAAIAAEVILPLYRADHGLADKGAISGKAFDPVTEADRGAEAAIRDLARISRPGCRVYIGRDEIKRVQGGLGICILTTPKGVMTGRQARREGVGGELLCEVW